MKLLRSILLLSSIFVIADIVNTPGVQIIEIIIGGFLIVVYVNLS